MTTIAWKDGILAADSRVSCGDRLVGHWSKLRVIEVAGERVAYALTGNQAYSPLFEAFLAKGEIHDELKKDGDDYWRAAVVRGGGLREYESGCLEIPRSDAPFEAWGSGTKYALGAMAAGASAEEAVKIASMFDLGTGGPVTTF